MGQKGQKDSKVSRALDLHVASLDLNPETADELQSPIKGDPWTQSQR